MTPGRNPSEERLLAYAAGVLSPPEAVVVAAHLALRPANDAWVRRLQQVGGALLETTPPASMSADALDRAMARIGTDAGDASAQSPLNEMASELPEPLRRYALGPWRWVGPGMRVRDVHAPRDGACRVILLKIDPGRPTPRHTHEGPRTHPCPVRSLRHRDRAVRGRGPRRGRPHGVAPAAHGVGHPLSLRRLLGGPDPTRRLAGPGDAAVRPPVIRLLPLWGAAAIFLGLVMCAAWVVQRRTGQGGWADAFWSFGLGAAGAGVSLIPLEGPPPAPRQWLVAALIGLWGLRLGLHIAAPRRR